MSFQIIYLMKIVNFKRFFINLYNILHSFKFVDIQLSPIYAGGSKHVHFKTRAFGLILTAGSFHFDPYTFQHLYIYATQIWPLLFHNKGRGLRKCSLFSFPNLQFIIGVDWDRDWVWPNWIGLVCLSSLADKSSFWEFQLLRKWAKPAKGNRRQLLWKWNIVCQGRRQEVIFVRLFSTSRVMAFHHCLQTRS